MHLESDCFLLSLLAPAQVQVTFTFFCMNVIISNALLVSQYSCLENAMDGGAWWAAVHGVAGSRTRLGNYTFTFHVHALEKEMATHSSVLA